MTRSRNDLAPVLSSEHVFGDVRAFAQCHASTLVRVPDGGFLVAWFAGERESTDDVAIWASRRGHEGAWSPPRVIAKVADVAHWNPVLFALEETGQELVLHFKVGERIRTWETWSQRSSDGGETWSTPAPLVPGDRGGRGAVRCKPIRLASGAWLAGASRERWRRWDAFFDRSPDGVGDWVATPDVPLDRRAFGGKGLIQPTLWTSGEGHVHALFRSTDGFVHRSDSEDDGRSWSRARPLAVPNNNSGIDAVRLPDGRVVLACNPVGGNWAARTPLSLLVSTDEGATFPDRVDVETDPGEFSYPALIGTPDGVALAYTWNRRRIAFAKIAARDLPGRGPAA
ncbi:MAG: sialidase family protein [Myxococcota bacterium]